MNTEKLRELVNYDSPSPRVAELAALFVQRSARILEVAGQRYGPTVERGTLSIDHELQPAYAARIAAKLVGIGESLHKLAEINCNTGLSPRDENRQERLEAQAVEIGEALGFKVETGGDPRGCVLKLYDPQDERLGDGWGGGWGVYS